MTEIGKLLANLPYVFKSAFPIEDTQSLLSIFEVNELEVCNFMALEITFILIIVHWSVMDSHCKLEELEKYDMNQRIVFILFLFLNPSII